MHVLEREQSMAEKFGHGHAGASLALRGRSLLRPARSEVSVHKACTPLHRPPPCVLIRVYEEAATALCVYDLLTTAEYHDSRTILSAFYRTPRIIAIALFAAVLTLRIAFDYRPKSYGRN